MLATDNVTGKVIVVVPVFPSTAEAPATLSAGLAASWTRNVATFVADVPPTALIVTFTFNSLPWALAGTTNASRAVPTLNDSACRSTVPATEGSQIIVPRDSRSPCRFGSP